MKRFIVDFHLFLSIGGDCVVRHFHHNLILFHLSEFPLDVFISFWECRFVAEPMEKEFENHLCRNQPFILFFVLSSSVYHYHTTFSLIFLSLYASFYSIHINFIIDLYLYPVYVNVYNYYRESYVRFVNAKTKKNWKYYTSYVGNSVLIIITCTHFYWKKKHF